MDDLIDERLEGTSVGMLAGLLFAVHPVHTEAVANVVGRAELLSAVYFMLSLLCFLRLGRKRTNPIGLGAVIILAGLGMLSKEQAVTVLGVCGAFQLLLAPGSGGGVGSKSRLIWQEVTAWRVVMLGTCGAVLLAFRGLVCGGAPQIFSSEDNPAAFEPELLTRALSYTNLYVLNALQLVWPARLCCDWNGAVALVHSVWDPRNLGGLLLYAMLLALLMPGILSLAPPFAPAGLISRLTVDGAEHGVTMIITFLPSSNIFLTVGFVIAERVLYLPSIGYCFLVSLGVHRVLGTTNRFALNVKARSLASRCRHWMVKAGIGALVLASAGKTMQRGRQWKTPEDLYMSGVAVNPWSYKLHYSLATALGEKQDAAGMYAELQERHYKISLQLKPTHANAYNNLGLMLAGQKRWKEAAECYRHALEHRESHSKAMSNLAVVLKELGQTEEAEALHRQALQLQPTDHKAQNNLGLLLMELGRTTEARKAHQMALDLAPGVPMYHNNLGAVYWKQGHVREAAAYYRAALRLNPAYGSALQNLVIAINKSGRLLETQRFCAQPRLPAALTAQQREEREQDCRALHHIFYLQETLRLDPKIVDALDNLGGVLASRREYVAALELFEKALALEPGYIPSLRNAGLTTRNLGRHAEAKQYQTKALAAIKRAPADDPYTTPAQVAAAHNDMVSFLLPRAKERLVGLADKRNDAVAGLANKSGATGNQAGVIEAELGDVNAARAHFLLAVKADPNHEAAKNLRLLRG
eukprot:gene2455-3189_t